MTCEALSEEHAYQNYHTDGIITTLQTFFMELSDGILDSITYKTIYNTLTNNFFENCKNMLKMHTGIIFRGDKHFPHFPQPYRRGLQYLNNKYHQTETWKGV